MISSLAQPPCLIEGGYELTKEPLWDESNGCLYGVDIANKSKS